MIIRRQLKIKEVSEDLNYEKKRGGAVVAHKFHMLKVAGSNPASATKDGDIKECSWDLQSRLAHKARRYLFPRL